MSERDYSKRPLMREWCASHNEEMLFADGFDAALVGVAERCGQPTLAVYDVELCINILMEEGHCTDREEALEHIEFNVIGAWMGENTPLFLRRVEM